MKQLLDQAIFSPSDLNHFLECEHLIQLELRRGDTPRGARDAHAELLAQKGLAHEQRWLQRFREDGRRVVELPASTGREWDADAERTIAAMRDGADVIYQGVFIESAERRGGTQVPPLDPPAVGWRGISDFLVRVETPSALGGWSYEAWDTKLARHSKPYFVLQLCFYTEQLARVQEREPAWMHVILGTGETDRFAYHDFSAYYRAVRARFLAAAASGVSTYPYPVSHCRLCEHATSCEEQWEADDHLSLLAGINREQVQRLNEVGVHTVAHLAACDDRLDVRIGSAPFARLKHQAALQADQRRTGTHRFELLPVDERTGFRLLPAPSRGDVFFDMEGDPYFEPAYGLEYLFGAVTTDGGAPAFTAFQALDRAEEKVAFEQFVDWIDDRLTRWPDLHVYHYAAYEVTALKRLMSVHGTREDALDELLRREVFVDLYQVVRQSLRMSHRSYSIKKVRTFFMDGAGRGAVTDGGDSILQFERWRETHDASILQAIVDYNREDCVSTLELRDWLLDRKRDAESAAGVIVPWKVVEVRPENPKRLEEDAETERRIDALMALASARRGGPSRLRQGFGEARQSAEGATAAGPPEELLAQLLGYHRRESKPEWWAFYDRRGKSLDHLLEDTQAIAGLRPAPDVEPELSGRSVIHTLEFPEQEFKLGEGAVDDPFRMKAAGSIEWIDAASGRLGLKRGPSLAQDPLPSAICAGKPLDQSVQRQALARLADAVLVAPGLSRPAKYAAARSLLARELPRVNGRPHGGPLQTTELAEQAALVESLDDSYLLIQGPPGAGKTWTGARLIISLIASGKRVGVAATSHKAINNLLAEVERAAAERGVTFGGLKKGKDDEPFDGRCIRDTDSNDDIEAALAVPIACRPGREAPRHVGGVSVIAGTAWLFSRPALDASLDYLFIDEAGQVSLADALAMSTAARNLVLLGDPQQLPQVRQGIHPGASGASVLEHVLRGAATVPEERGLFLECSWRMHPDVCGFISALAYENRLSSAPGRDRQRIDSAGFSGTGLRFLAVQHSGNSQRSLEEGRAIGEQVQALLEGGVYTGVDGQPRPLAARDILVVAPYNMQVRCIREQLPEGVEVGTVDKFQGREAPVVFFSMASSTGQDVPRGLEFLFSRNRFNVAISRAQALAVVVCSPRLLDVRCRSVEQMRLVNALCGFVERAR
jgi:predicted RecB family nuclease